MPTPEPGVPWTSGATDDMTAGIEARNDVAEAEAGGVSEAEVEALVDDAVAGLVDSSPAALDTLNELAAALGDDPNFATTVTNTLAGKQPIDPDLTALAAAGNSATLGATTAAFTTADETKLDALPTAAALTTSLAAKSDKTPVTGLGLGTTGTVDIDMAALNDTRQAIALTGNITLTTSGMADGRSVTVKISAAVLRTLAFDPWTWLGPVPTQIAAGKTGVLSLTAFGATDADVLAVWSVQS